MNANPEKTPAIVSARTGADEIKFPIACFLTSVTFLFVSMCLSRSHYGKGGQVGIATCPQPTLPNVILGAFRHAESARRINLW
jgi:hypothetical protein